MAEGLVLAPPIHVKEMTELNRELFEKNISLVALSLNETDIGKVISAVKKLLLTSLKNVKPVQKINGEKKIMLLDPHKVPDAATAKELLCDMAAFKNINYEVVLHTIKLGYENWSAEEILKAVLPNDLPAVSSFALVGHVAHLNLKDTHTPFKTLIGQVLLDKHINIETVVNKTDTIDNTYRNFKMELLAGKDNFDVAVRENGCTFNFDFAKVYWNTRLGTEHKRIVEEISCNAVLYDVFAGVGPFSIPLAKKGVVVFGNDLNPESYKALSHNMLKNKVSGKYQLFNLDGREFIATVVKQDLSQRLGDDCPIAVVMNLPALAIEFLDSFVGLLEGLNAPESRSPLTIYCYCFSKAKDGRYEVDTAYRVNQAIGIENLVLPAMCRRVRNVAPNKEMMCVKLILSWGILCSGDMVKNKRRKLDCDTNFIN